MKKQILLLFSIAFSSSLIFAQEPGENAALLVIDMQDEFTRGTMEVTSAEELIKNVNEAIEALRPIEVIFIKADIQMLTISLKGIRKEPAEHTALDKRLDQKDSDVVMTKSESSALTVEELNAFLEEKEISHLYLVGIFLGQCLSNTAIDAVEKGYNVSVIREAVNAKKENKAGKYLNRLKEQGVEILELRDLD